MSKNSATITVRVQEEDFSLQAEYDRLRTIATGAIVTFSGLVRDFNGPGLPSGEVSALHLQHYPGMTERLLRQIVDEACERWPVHGVTVIHRVGTLEPGEQIVLVAVSSSHRESAFCAAEFLMDYLKTRATFWKKSLSSAGEEWLEMKDSDRDAAARWHRSGDD